MNLRPLARTEFTVSELCLGTLSFGWKADEHMSAAILDAFRAAGGNFIQATSCSAGASDLAATADAEKHVGSWMRDRRVPRAAIVLATRLVMPEGAWTDRTLAAGLREQCTASLRRLRTDHLDLLLCEWHSALLPLERLLAALAPLVDEGLVRHLGASGFPAWRAMAALNAAERSGLPRFAAVQHDYSIVERRLFETEYADLCHETRTAFLARSPLAGGFLAPRPRRSAPWTERTPAARLRDRFMDRHSLGVRDVLDAIALSRGLSVAQVALAWVLSRPGVTSAVVGVASVEQFKGLAGATRLRLTGRELAMLEQAATLHAVSLLDDGAGSARPPGGRPSPAGRGALRIQDLVTH